MAALIMHLYTAVTVSLAAVNKKIRLIECLISDS